MSAVTSGSPAAVNEPSVSDEHEGSYDQPEDLIEAHGGLHGTERIAGQHYDPGAVLSGSGSGNDGIRDAAGQRLDLLGELELEQSHAAVRGDKHSGHHSAVDHQWPVRRRFGGGRLLRSAAALGRSRAATRRGGEVGGVDDVVEGVDALDGRADSGRPLRGPKAFALGRYEDDASLAPGSLGQLFGQLVQHPLRIGALDPHLRSDAYAVGGQQGHYDPQSNEPTRDEVPGSAVGGSADPVEKLGHGEVDLLCSGRRRG